MHIIAGIILVLIGLLAVLSPKTAWYLRCGWRFRNAEPSEAALILERIGGVIFVMAGIGFLFIRSF